MSDFARMLLASGYPVREPYDGERKFFDQNRNVAGYAAPGGDVVLNPYAHLSEQGRQSVALNEAARHRMMDTGRVFSAEPTPSQAAFFAKTPYGSQPQMMRHTIAARILAGDPSAGPYTPEQKAEAQSVLDGLLLGAIR